MSNRFEEMMKMLISSDDRRHHEMAQYMATQYGVPVPGGRPPLPATMLGLECAVNPGDLLAVGDGYSASGFDDNGLMNFMLSCPERPYGGVAITRDQARQLRDFLSAKLGD